MATFVIAHGAWSAAWAWKKMRPLMRAAGHELVTPTHTGLGERWHLSSPDVTLDTHIQDQLGVLETEDLSDVILVGHSYGGMVATGVADRARERVSSSISTRSCRATASARSICSRRGIAAECWSA